MVCEGSAGDPNRRYLYWLRPQTFSNLARGVEGLGARLFGSFMFTKAR